MRTRSTTWRQGDSGYGISELAMPASSAMDDRQDVLSQSSQNAEE